MLDVIIKIPGDGTREQEILLCPDTLPHLPSSQFCARMRPQSLCLPWAAAGAFLLEEMHCCWKLNVSLYDFFQVHLRSHFIMNGVCVRWKGWLDLERLDGVGCLEYDEEFAAVSFCWILKMLESSGRDI